MDEIDRVWGDMDRTTSPHSPIPNMDGYSINETTTLLCEDEAIDLGRAPSEDSETSSSDELQQTELLNTAKSAKDSIIGMVCVAAGTMFICAGGSIAAFIGGSVLEIMLGRFLIQAIMSFAWWYLKKPEGFDHWYGDEGSEIKIWIHGALYWILIFGWYRGLELVPIGDAEAIVFLAPVLIVILGRIVLKEPLSTVFPGTIILTLSGILFVCQPNFIFRNVPSRAVPFNGIMFLVIMAISWACASTIVRSAKKAHWLQITVVATVEGTVIWTPLAILINSVIDNDFIAGGPWLPITWGNFGLICLCAIFASAGLALNVIGYQIGEATKVAWMEYMDLIFAFAFQWLMFGRSPNLWEWLGCLCLMSTCALHLLEEAIKLRKSENELHLMEVSPESTYSSAIDEAF